MKKSSVDGSLDASLLNTDKPITAYVLVGDFITTDMN